MSKDDKITDNQVDEIMDKIDTPEDLTKEDEETLTDWIIQLVGEVEKEQTEELSLLKETVVYWLPIDGDN